MRSIFLTAVIVAGSFLAAQGMEVLALSSKGAVYVKKPGKRFAETIKLDTRYGEGTTIKTDDGGSVELLLSDNTILTISGNSSWKVGDDPTYTGRQEKPAGKVSLWDMTLGVLNKSGSSASKSNIVGSIRVAGAEQDLENEYLNEDDKATLAASLESFENIEEFSKYKMSAMILSGYGQYADAEKRYLQAMDSAADDDSFNQILDYLTGMLREQDRPKMAENYEKKRK